MQVRIFTIPVLDDGSTGEEMNAFLRGQKILTIDKELLTLNNQAYWTFCITYLPQGGTSAGPQRKTDYKDVLDAATFAKFSRLRTLRKQIAENEGLPAYAVFTDAELADIARLDEISVKNIKKVANIGQKKAEKYGSVIAERYAQTAEESDADKEETAVTANEKNGLFD